MKASDPTQKSELKGSSGSSIPVHTDALSRRNRRRSLKPPKTTPKLSKAPSSMIETSNRTGHSYRFVKKLGSGAMGTVWEAIRNADPEKGIPEKRVAIKILIPSANNRETELELNALHQISQIGGSDDVCSKYAVCLYDFYPEKRPTRIVMNYISGKPLGHYLNLIPLKERKHMDAWTRNLITGLNFVHNHGITHQDIKEANIMYDEDNQRAIFVDWGLSCLRPYCLGGRDDTICDVPCDTSGTAYTTPPETKKWGGGNEKTFNMSKAHDIWSLGVVLYDWYALNNYKSVLEYSKGERGYLGGQLSENSFYAMSQSQINDKISEISSEFGRKVVGLMLTRDWRQRLANWGKIMEITHNSASQK